MANGSSKESGAAAPGPARTPRPTAWVVEFNTCGAGGQGIPERHVVFDEPEGPYAGCVTARLFSTPDQSVSLLSEAAALFREYEAHHRAKGDGAETTARAERNAEIASRIEAHLAHICEPRGLEAATS